MRQREEESEKEEGTGFTLDVCLMGAAAGETNKSEMGHTKWNWTEI